MLPTAFALCAESAAQDAQCNLTRTYSRPSPRPLTTTRCPSLPCRRGWSKLPSSPSPPQQAPGPSSPPLPTAITLTKRLNRLACISCHWISLDLSIAAEDLPNSQTRADLQRCFQHVADVPSPGFISSPVLHHALLRWHQRLCRTP